MKSKIDMVCLHNQVSLIFIMCMLFSSLTKLIVVCPHSILFRGAEAHHQPPTMAPATLVLGTSRQRQPVGQSTHPWVRSPYYPVESQPASGSRWRTLQRQQSSSNNFDGWSGSILPSQNELVPSISVSGSNTEHCRGPSLISGQEGGSGGRDEGARIAVALTP